MAAGHIDIQMAANAWLLFAELFYSICSRGEQFHYTSKKPMEARFHRGRLSTPAAGLHPNLGMKPYARGGVWCLGAPALGTPFLALSSPLTPVLSETGDLRRTIPSRP